jgi:6-phosphogluconolactonase
MSARITGWLPAVAAVMAATASAHDRSPTTVYTETNDAAGNAVQVYRTAADASLSLATEVKTGGLGSGGGLGNQGALAITANGHWLFAVNAGSDELTVFAVTHAGLKWVDKVHTGGAQPVSVTAHDDLVYVLNAGGSGNIAGFHLLLNGHLKPIPGSIQPLSSATAGPAQIAFDRDGDRLVVTEKATNKLSIYALADDVAQTPSVRDSNGKTPFGFAFDRHGDLLVSDAFGGATNASALSSYDIDEESDSLEVISGSVPTHQSAACWVVLARHGRFAYVTNTGSGTITGYRVRHSGELIRLDADGITGTTGGAPTDAAAGRDGRILFVLSPSIGRIVSFEVRSDGSVVNLGSAIGPPATATGLVAR